MIFLNGKSVDINHFADGTLLIKEDIPREYEKHRYAVICWQYECEKELVALYFLTRHLQEHGVGDITLEIPYLPNARQDRVKNNDDVFTLKYFAEIVNNLHYTCIKVFDPHSSVAEALIDRIYTISAKKPILETISIINDPELILFFPDEGSMKRYSKMTDWETREIRELSICGPVKRLKDKPILMVDDICSSGKTLLFAAKKLKEIGVGKVYLYVSHCERQALNSELLNSDIIERMFTTRSLLTEEHPKIKFIAVEEMKSV